MSSNTLTITLPPHSGTTSTGRTVGRTLSLGRGLAALTTPSKPAVIMDWYAEYQAACKEREALTERLAQSAREIAKGQWELSKATSRITELELENESLRKAVARMAHPDTTRIRICGREGDTVFVRH